MSILSSWAPEVTLEFTEFDVLQGGAEHDLADHKRQTEILEAVRAGAYHLIIMSPP